MQNREILEQLQQVLIERKAAKVNESYVASLYDKGLDHILKKVGEESSEVIIAAKGSDATELTKEVADLLFHCMVLLVSKDIGINDVLTELDHRFGISGLEEKANRKN
ncbi:MAG: phosphoribosyl-ATP diphosphatase [Gammaproteobacteria bacterium]|nr:phosphoribosyl-ATP diphosphatase [Gammaproteobacteria bacterium]